MSYGACPSPREDCRYYDSKIGCRSNEHHIYKRQEAKVLGKTALEFCCLPSHVVRLCQDQHETIEAIYGWPDYPPIGVMKEIIEDKNGRNTEV